MSQSRSSRSPRRNWLLTAIAVMVAVLTAGATTTVASATTRTPAATSTHVIEKTKSKAKGKKKPKKKAKKKTHKSSPKPKGTTTTAPAGPPTTTENPPSGNYTITEDGSSLLLPLFQQWASAYHGQHGNVTINPSGGGSGKGQSDAASGVVNIGASDAYLSPTQFQQNPGIMNIALAISAQMIVTNINGLSGNQHLDLSGPVLSDIYQGKITYWNDPSITKLNPGLTLPHQQIVALHRIDSSGDTFIFTQYLSDSDASGWGSSVGYGTTVNFPSIPNALGESGNGGMVAGCNDTPGCIAYIGISYESQVKSDSMQINALANASGNYELPNASTITAEAHAVESETPASETLSLIYDNASGGYPIINYEYAIALQKQPNANEAAAVRAFLDWAVDPTNGSNSSFLDAVNFIPLTPAVQALTVAQIAKIGS